MLFGSRARGNYHKNSDIDIAILENISENDKYAIINEFDCLDIIYKIDLVFISKDTKIDGILYRFEFTFELAWKTMKDNLEYLGVIAKTGSPREVIKSAFEYNLIEDGEEWINMMLSRNMLSHIYDEKQSREIYNKVKDKYAKMFSELLDRI